MENHLSIPEESKAKNIEQVEEITSVNDDDSEEETIITTDMMSARKHLSIECDDLENMMSSL